MRSLSNILLGIDCVIQIGLVLLIITAVPMAILVADEPLMVLAASLVPVGIYQLAVSNTLHIIISMRIEKRRLIYICLSVFTLIMGYIEMPIPIFWGWGQASGFFSAFLSFQGASDYFNKSKNNT